MAPHDLVYPGVPRDTSYPSKLGPCLPSLHSALSSEKLSKGYCCFEWLNVESGDFDKNETFFCSLSFIHPNKQKQNIVTAIMHMTGHIQTHLQGRRSPSTPDHFYPPNHWPLNAAFIGSAWHNLSFTCSSVGYPVISLGKWSDVSLPTWVWTNSPRGEIEYS